MNNTLKMLSPLITKEARVMQMDELILRYQSSQSPIYLATMFEKTFKMAIKLAQKFPNLNPDDISSFTLQTLDRTMLKFNFQNKFTTYLHKCLYLDFYRKNKYLQSEHKKINFGVVNLDDVFSAGETDNNIKLILEEPYSLLNTNLVMFNLKKLNCSELQYRYCELILNDFSNRQISKELEIGYQSVLRLKNKLRNKEVYKILT